MKTLKYNQWLKTVPETITGDALWNMIVYRYALFLSDLVWYEINYLNKKRSLMSACDQLFRSAGSISANISEGYSRHSKRDQARYYEYARGSAREVRGWYFKLRHVLEEALVASRLELITEIIRMLLKIIPANRGKKIEEPPTEYLASDEQKFKNVEFFEFRVLT